MVDEIFISTTDCSTASSKSAKLGIFTVTFCEAGVLVVAAAEAAGWDTEVFGVDDATTVG